MTKDNAAYKNTFSKLITFLLLGSVGLAVISHLIGIELEIETYKDLKSYFFVPLKKWIFPVIAASMFSIFFRSPDGRATKFFILLADIMVLYVLSTFIANVYAFSVFPLFPFEQTIAPIIGTVNAVTFNKIAPDGMPLVIWVMIIGIAASFIFRYFLHNTFCAVAMYVCKILVLILSPKILDRVSFIKTLKDDHKEALDPKKGLKHSLVLINFVDKVIFLVLMAILMLAPLAVYSSFLSILNVRGFQFFFDLGRFIAFYAFILFSYQFIVMPIVRKIFCLGIKGETYGSFFRKSLPVMATAATTASSMATLAVNIKAAQSLKVDDDMKDVGHNRALMPIGATFNMDGTSISLVVYFLLAASMAGIDVGFWWVVLTAVGLSVGTAAVPSASLIMLTSMYSAFSIPASLTGKLLSIIIAVDPIHDRIRTIVNTWGDLNMVYIVQSKRGIASMLRRATIRRKKKK